MQLYWVALKSIWTKEIHRFMRIWVQTLVPPVITMTLYFVIFGNLIGSRIGEMHGFTYMQFIVETQANGDLYNRDPGSRRSNAVAENSGCNGIADVLSRLGLGC